MDPGRIFYQITRFYVWLLVLIAAGTIALIAAPRIVPTATVAGLWFAVAGFGSLVMVTAFLIYMHD